MNHYATGKRTKPYNSTQIIVTKELEEKNHIWLKALSDQMKKEQLRRLLEHVEGMTQKLKRELADSVLDIECPCQPKDCGGSCQTD